MSVRPRRDRGSPVHPGCRRRFTGPPRPKTPGYRMACFRNSGSSVTARTRESSALRPSIMEGSLPEPTSFLDEIPALRFFHREPVFFDLPVDGAARNAERPCGRLNVAVIVAESLFEGGLLHVPQ